MNNNNYSNRGEPALKFDDAGKSKQWNLFHSCSWQQLTSTEIQKTRFSKHSRLLNNSN